MIRSAKRIMAVLALALMAVMGPITVMGSAAQAQTDGQQRVVERARLALNSFLDDPNFGEMRVYVQNAYAVLIVPELLRAGFFFGAEYGIGVLLVRDPQTGASGPAGVLLALRRQCRPAVRRPDLRRRVHDHKIKARSTSCSTTASSSAPTRVSRPAASGCRSAPRPRPISARTSTRSPRARVCSAASGWTAPTSPANGPWNQAYYGHPVDPRQLVRQPTVVASAEIDALHQSLTRFLSRLPPSPAAAPGRRARP